MLRDGLVYAWKRPTHRMDHDNRAFSSERLQHIPYRIVLLLLLAHYGTNVIAFTVVIILMRATTILLDQSAQSRTKYNYPAYSTYHVYLSIISR